MAKTSGKPAASIYQIKVTLQWSEPPIWRRFQVRRDSTLGDLHAVLQAVMGWEDYHLHQFVIRDTYYGEADTEADLETKDEHKTKLSDVVSRARQKFTYEYDFGDGWQHELRVEKALPADPGVRYPVCLGGERACPPEDVGGIGGYAVFLETIENPQHPEHEEMLEWIGGDFDPDAFDLKKVNRALRAIG